MVEQKSTTVYISRVARYGGRDRRESMSIATRQSPREAEPRPPDSSRHRDAVSTRRRLLDAARLRFARDGYSSTKVRDVATDAGVNVALINRYFVSKEGLFEACLTGAAEELHRSEEAEVTIGQVIDTIITQVADSPSGEHSIKLMLLLRSSGDERTEQIRRSAIARSAERIAAAAGWRPDDPDGDALLLRAQVALSVGLGLVLLRSSSGLEPLGSANEGELCSPVRDLLTSVLTPSAH